MSPSISLENMMNNDFVHSEYFRNRSLGLAFFFGFKNKWDVGFFQFGMGAERTSFNHSFFKSMAHIIGLCSKPKMRRVNAKFIIETFAIMKNEFISWYLPFVERIREPMSRNILLNGIFPCTDMSVSTRHNTSSPEPAGFCFFNFRPEIFFDRNWFWARLHPIHLLKIKELCKC